MNNPRYQAIIKGATETRNIDFKRSINWRTYRLCGRLEILKDIAALANVGGGFIIIGRDEPTLTSGSLTQEDADSFDPTAVNSFVHRYLSPSIECRIEVERVGSDTLIVIDVPDFETSPLIFQKIGNCDIPNCKKSPHFKAADIFIRTKAQQSQRIEDPDDMRDLFKRGMLKAKDELLASIQRALSSSSSIEEPLSVSPYDDEHEHAQQEFFGPIFSPWLMHTGHVDLEVKPAIFRQDRIDLYQVSDKIREYNYRISRRGIVDSVPYEGQDVSNFSGGCRMKVLAPQWRRYEAVSLHQSGLYRLVRTFMEDFKPNKDRTEGILIHEKRELWVDTFVEQMTMVHLLARNIARDLLEDADEEIQLDLRVDGLAGRTLTTNIINHDLRFDLSLSGTTGSENIFKFPLRITLRALEVDAAHIARERCNKILWTFGLRADGLVTKIQQAFLGRV